MGQGWNLPICFKWNLGQKNRAPLVSKLGLSLSSQREGKSVPGLGMETVLSDGSSGERRSGSWEGSPGREKRCVFRARRWRQALQRGAAQAQFPGARKARKLQSNALQISVCAPVLSYRLFKSRSGQLLYICLCSLHPRQSGNQGRSHERKHCFLGSSSFRC